MYKSVINKYHFDIYIPNLEAELLGFIFIGLVFLLTLLIALRWPPISKVILAAFAVRVFVLLMGHFFFHLPDSNADAIGFESGAWKMAEEGFINVFKHFPGANSFFYSWMMAIPYSLFGRSILMIQSIGLLCGIGTVILGWHIAKKLWDDRTAINVGWFIALFPSLILYSVLTLREVYAIFFLLVAILGIVNWARDKSLKSIILTITGFIGAGFFHGALLIGGIIFGIIVSIRSIKIFFFLILNSRINLKHFIIVVASLVILGAFFSSKFKIAYLGNFKTSITIERLQDTINVRMKGDASYSEWTKINSPVEIIYKVPVRIIYFLFSPFPWNVKKLSHLISLIDGFLYMILLYLIFCNRKAILNDPALRIILLILICYLIIWGVGISNFGAAFRHRTKFVIEFILLAAPLLPRLNFSKKNISDCK